MPLKQVNVRKHKRSKPSGGKSNVRSHTRKIHGASPKILGKSKSRHKALTKLPSVSQMKDTRFRLTHGIRLIGRTKEGKGKNVYYLPDKGFYAIYGTGQTQRLAKKERNQFRT